MSQKIPEAVEERILLLATTGSDSAGAENVLTRAGFSVRVCKTLNEACREISSGAAALLVAEESLSPEAVNGFVACIRDQPAWSDLPIILITGHGQINTSSTQLFELLAEGGNISLLERPFRINTLLSTLRMALRSRRRQYQVRDLLATVQQANCELEQRVAERTAQLNSSVKSLESFCHSLAHDLRAPLRAIRSFMAVIESDYSSRLDDEGVRLLRRVSSAGERMDLLINDLLALSRLGQGNVPLVDVHAAKVAADAVETLQAEVKKTGADVQLDLMDDRARANPVILRQVLENFLSNALKYARKGETPRVRIWSQKKERRLRICVQDNGIGVPPEHRERIFEIFRRLHGNEYPGTGVGLAIAKAGAERMHGNVGVDSNDGPGSCFWVELEAA